MAKFTKELAKLFRKITNSEIDAEGNAHVVLFPADSLLINNARIALASLEAEAVAYMHHSGQVVTREECCDDKIFAICCKVETPLYAAPQLPQPAVPDMAAVGEMPFLGTQENAFVSGWNACRAAMLQGKVDDEVGSWNNHMNTPTAKPAIDTGEPLKHIEGMEVSVDVSTCDADAGHRYFGTVTEISELDTAKNGYILLVQDAKPNFKPAGNSPVTPDGLLCCGENCWSCGKYFTYEQHSECDGYCPHCNSPVDLDDEEEQPSKVVPTEPTEEMISNAWREAIGKCDHETIKRIYATMLAAAPQQEVK